MKPTQTKAQIRKELEKQIEQYLDTGGDVKDIPRGISGRNDNSNPFSQFNHSPKAENRTPVGDVIKSMEERKQPQKPVKKRPKKRLIKDDFGEPLRWVWDEE